MGGANWQVLIADLRGSRAVPARDRLLVDRGVRRALVRLGRRHAPHFRLAPAIELGDEIQAVLRPRAPALSILTCLRALLVSEIGREPQLRAGIGCGAISRLSPRGPFHSTGEAFHRARAAIEDARARGGTRRTAWVSGDDDFDGLADVVLGLVDAFETSWTVAQWEVAAARLEGKGLHEIARRAGISFQSVSKRLRAASWNEVQRSVEWLEAAACGEVGRAPAAPGPARGRPAAGARRSPRTG